MSALRRQCGYSAALWLGLFCTLFLLSSAAAKPARPKNPAPPTGKPAPPAPPLSEQSEPYDGAWSCRYGDSPVAADGARAWAQPTSRSVNAAALTRPK